MSKEGSRNVSLGPYRSAELALEERLTRKEAKVLASDIKKDNFGEIIEYTAVDGSSEGISKREVSIDSLTEIICALGYEKEAECLYVRHESQDDKFVYLDKSEYSTLIVISGTYGGNPENILADIEVVREMQAHHLAKVPFWRPNSSSRGVVGFTMAGLYAGVIAAILSGITAPSHENLLAVCAYMFGGAAIGFFSSFSVLNATYKCRQEKFVLCMSNNAKSYLYGKEAYNQIMPEYNEKKTKQLESSKTKQLPEKKEWAENQICPETFVVSEAMVKYFEKPESERPVIKSSPAFEGPAMLEVEIKK